MRHFETQEERLDYLLQEFKKDSVEYKDLEVEDHYESKRMALRSLMNIRMPKKMADDIVSAQDEFLTLEAKEKGIVTLSDIKTVREQYGSEFDRIIFNVFKDLDKEYYEKETQWNMSFQMKQ